jgi:hypothetical protein
MVFIGGDNGESGVAHYFIIWGAEGQKENEDLRNCKMPEKGRSAPCVTEIERAGMLR